MKKPREASQAGRREQRTPPRHKDPYRRAIKPAAAACPRCGATFRSGRWSWRTVEGPTREQTCPACERIERNDPAGFVTLRGPFFREHRAEIMARVNTLAARARDEHPLERIVSAQELPDGVLVTTTEPHLARAIAVALHHAFHGGLELHFGEGESQVRATWWR